MREDVCNRSFDRGPRQVEQTAMVELKYSVIEQMLQGKYDAAQTINIYAAPAITHAPSDGTGFPIRHVPNLAHTQPDCIVSVTLRVELRMQPIASGVWHAELEFLRPPQASSPTPTCGCAV
jgi:hypothetical protein